jgi:hypothetical protein
MITSWAACDFIGNWENTTIRAAALPEVEDHTIDAGAGILVLVFDRLQLEAGYYFRNNDSTDPLRSYTSNRLYAFMTYHFRPVAPGGLPVSVLSRLDDLTVEVSPSGR